MRIQGHTPIPRYRAYAGPALLAQGFRPLYLLAGIWAALALALSVAMFEGRIALPSAFDAVAWHVHEMLFGFVAAAVAGYALTTVPNWTGRLPLQGAPLVGLVALWLAGRAAVAVSALIGAWPAALIDLAFLFVLAAATLREVVAGRHWRSLPIVLALLLLLLGNALSHAEAAGTVDAEGLARRFAVAVVVALITVVGGRIVPSFTRNWLARRGARVLPPGMGAFDRATLGATAAALIAWVAAPDAAVAAVCLGFAALLNVARLARWRGHATYSEPLLWVLHAGYLWIPVGFALLAAGHWWPAVSRSAALHALTAGAMGTMTLAVMSRAVLRNAGRAQQAGTGLAAAFVLVTAAALLRVAAALWSAAFTPLLIAAAGAWVAAFLFYLGVCGPLLVARRPRRRAG